MDTLKEAKEKLKKNAEAEANLEELRKYKLEKLKKDLALSTHRFAAEHPLFTFPYFALKETKPNLAVKEHLHELGTQLKNLAERAREHMARVSSNRAFAQKLKEGAVALNPATGAVIKKDSSRSQGYLVLKRAVKV